MLERSLFWGGCVSPFGSLCWAGRVVVEYLLEGFAVRFGEVASGGGHVGDCIWGIRVLLLWW